MSLLAGYHWFHRNGIPIRIAVGPLEWHIKVVYHMNLFTSWRSVLAKIVRVLRSPADADGAASSARRVFRKITMRFTTYSDYTLRVLIQLAVCPRYFTTIAEIADSYGIPKNHLTKVVHRLGLGGYIDTVGERSNEIRLLKNPANINVSEVVHRAEPDFDLLPCFNGSGSCVIEPACVLKGVLREARDAFLVALDRYTLADLVTPRRKLTALLELEARPT